MLSVAAYCMTCICKPCTPGDPWLPGQPPTHRVTPELGQTSTPARCTAHVQQHCTLRPNNLRARVPKCTVSACVCVHVLSFLTGPLPPGPCFVFC